MGRKFQLTDIMIVVAAAAMALSWYRLGSEPHPMRWTSASINLQSVFGRWLGSAILTLLFSSLALALLWIRSPGLRWSKLVTQPGFSACLLASLWVLVQIVLFCLAEGLGELPVMGTTVLPVHVTYWARRWFSQSFHEFASTGLLVLAGWCFLAAAGLWRPRPTWADRLGRVLGVGWILVWFLKALLLVPGFA